MKSQNQTPILLPERLKTAIKVKSKELGISMAGLIRLACVEYLNK